MSTPEPTTPREDPLSQRLTRLEELTMFSDHRHASLASMVNELSMQIAAMHKTIDQLSRRIKDVERQATSADPQRTAEDELPPHNAF